jgi:hypothetical protein
MSKWLTAPLVVFAFWAGLMLGMHSARAEGLAWPFRSVSKQLDDEERARRKLPPAEFDHEVDPEEMKVSLHRGEIELLQLACSKVVVKAGNIIVGCSKINVAEKRCSVYILNDALLERYRLSYDDIWRHERGHCNGWRHYQEYVDRSIQPAPRDITGRTPPVQPVWAPEPVNEPVQPPPRSVRTLRIQPEPTFTPAPAFVVKY